MSYVKFDIPDKVKEDIKRAVSKVSEKRDSKIRKGMNEVTKSIERGNAKLVIMAEDVNPPEILFHVPLLCEEKNIPYAYLTKKEDVGKIVGINVGSSAIAVENVGSGNEGILDDIIKKLGQLKK